MPDFHFKKFSFVISTAILCTIAFQVSAQRTISGRILNINSGLPVEDAAISVFKGTSTATSNKRGHFQMTVSADDTLIFTHPDYKTGLIAVPAVDVFVAYMEQYHYYPDYLDGIELLYRYFQEQLKYPKKARNRGLEGLLFVEVLIDSTGRISSCKALNEIGSNVEDEIVEIFKSIPGGWTPFDIPLEKRLIFPLELRLGFTEVHRDLKGIKLPEGKLMPMIVLTAIS